MPHLLNIPTNTANIYVVNDQPKPSTMYVCNTIEGTTFFMIHYVDSDEFDALNLDIVDTNGINISNTHVLYKDVDTAIDQNKDVFERCGITESSFEDVMVTTVKDFESWKERGNVERSMPSTYVGGMYVDDNHDVIYAHYNNYDDVNDLCIELIRRIAYFDLSEGDRCILTRMSCVEVQ